MEEMYDREPGNASVAQDAIAAVITFGKWRHADLLDFVATADAAARMHSRRGLRWCISGCLAIAGGYVVQITADAGVGFLIALTGSVAIVRGIGAINAGYTPHIRIARFITEQREHDIS